MARAGRRANGQFEKGSHWREPKPHWQRDWLQREYVQRQRSASNIAAEAGCTENNIHFWLKKHGISRRTVSEARAIKRWGSFGSANPMFGRTGPANPAYKDGSAPERQRLYAQGEGKSFLRRIYARDGWKCRRCSVPKKGLRSIHAHHVRPWAGNPSLRFDEANLVTLCRSCHHWIHSKRNVGREYLA